MQNETHTPKPAPATKQETEAALDGATCSPSVLVPKDFEATGTPVTAWAFYEVFERKHCGTGWLRAQMGKMEAALNEVIKAAPAGGPLWHGSAQIEAARRALDSENA